MQHTQTQKKPINWKQKLWRTAEFVEKRTIKIAEYISENISEMQTKVNPNPRLRQLLRMFFDEIDEQRKKKKLRQYTDVMKAWLVSNDLVLGQYAEILITLGYIHPNKILTLNKTQLQQLADDAKINHKEHRRLFLKVKDTKIKLPHQKMGENERIVTTNNAYIQSLIENNKTNLCFYLFATYTYESLNYPKLRPILSEIKQLTCEFDWGQNADINFLIDELNECSIVILNQKIFFSESEKSLYFHKYGSRLCAVLFDMYPELFKNNNNAQQILFSIFWKINKISLGKIAIDEEDIIIFLQEIKYLEDSIKLAREKLNKLDAQEETIKNSIQNESYILDDLREADVILRNKFLFWIIFLNVIENIVIFIRVLITRLIGLFIYQEEKKKPKRLSSSQKFQENKRLSSTKLQNIKQRFKAILNENKQIVEAAVQATTLGVATSTATKVTKVTTVPATASAITQMTPAELSIQSRSSSSSKRRSCRSSSSSKRRSCRSSSSSKRRSCRSSSSKRNNNIIKRLIIQLIKICKSFLSYFFTLVSTLFNRQGTNEQQTTREEQSTKEEQTTKKIINLSPATTSELSEDEKLQIKKLLIAEPKLDGEILVAFYKEFDGLNKYHEKEKLWAAKSQEKKIFTNQEIKIKLKSHKSILIKELISITKDISMQLDIEKDLYKELEDLQIKNETLFNRNERIMNKIEAGIKAYDKIMLFIFGICLVLLMYIRKKLPI